MLGLINRIFSTLAMLAIACLVLITTACGAEVGEEDISPITSLVTPSVTSLTIEAQAAPETSPTAELESASTRLPTELVEPALPISPVKQPTTLSNDNRNNQPIPGSEDALAAAIADLAEQTGMSETEITLISMEAMEWSDASLGCPQEGFMYAQVITPGYLMILEAGGQQYEYHTDQTNSIVLCQE